MKKLSKEEFAFMVKLLRRFASSDMDQFENWMMDTEYGKVYISISREISENEDMYLDIDSFVES